MNCKYCNSADTVKFGTYGSTQLYFCKDCKRKFTARDTLFKMKVPVEQIALAISMYYDGMSLNAIRRNLKQAYGNYPSDSTVYEWVVRFTKQAVEQSAQYKPKVGQIWMADETTLNIGGKKMWLWDVIDVKTRFLLASHISDKRTVEDAQILMYKASQKAGKVPKVMMTDGLNSYVDGIALAYGSKVKHVQTTPFGEKESTNVIERMQGIIKDRAKVMRGLKTLTSARLIVDGFLVHYNFFRPHSALSSKQDSYRTPSEEAGIKFPSDNWLGIIRQTRLDGQQPRGYVKPIPIQFPQTPEQIKRARERIRKRVVRARQRQAAPRIVSPRW